MGAVTSLFQATSMFERMLQPLIGSRTTGLPALSSSKTRNAHSGGNRAEHALAAVELKHLGLRLPIEQQLERLPRDQAASGPISVWPARSGRKLSRLTRISAARLR